jgi:hypothetical protein
MEWLTVTRRKSFITCPTDWPRGKGESLVRAEEPSLGQLVSRWPKGGLQGFRVLRRQHRPDRGGPRARRRNHSPRLPVPADAENKGGNPGDKCLYLSGGRVMIGKSVTLYDNDFTLIINILP